MARIATREKLFTAAIELIAESGLAATTVDQIAERAGVAKGTVYYNFDSKAALFAALLEYGVDRLAAALREAASGRPPLEALEAVVTAELVFIGEHESFARLLIAETWRAGGDWQHAARLIRERAIGVVADVLREAVTTGDLRSDLDTDTAASAVFGMVLTVALDWRALQPGRSLDDVRATLLALLRGRLTT
ncbi:TetR/AcrR family transcriptional regulator [Actinomadura citrea]|uniref:AcrR family transcriptional regulator n=1 Tax=Actinomadura citrea TaxID=46158 RepID=A0A7Y9KIC1_9ACTN|nr:TetR/AcrR family transcriptional regulator [Actinomadura citrea]NYE16928.1 AcrR family transcriptional regulator [Actinomadura citrea]GGT58982.1 TetR family transcriptional regulator [Actinomadura citrea]